MTAATAEQRPWDYGIDPEIPEPPPDDGESCYMLVGYTGTDRALRYVKVAEGPGGRYYFAGDPQHRLQWVLLGDVPKFKPYEPEYKITDRRLDYGEQRRQREREALAAEIAARLTTPKAGAGGKVGRPAGSGVGTLVAHLREKKGLAWPAVRSFLLQGPFASGPEYGVEALKEDDWRDRLEKWASDGKAPHESSCPYCRGEPLPSAVPAR